MLRLGAWESLRRSFERNGEGGYVDDVIGSSPLGRQIGVCVESGVRCGTKEWLLRRLVRLRRKRVVCYEGIYDM